MAKGGKGKKSKAQNKNKKSKSKNDSGSGNGSSNNNDTTSNSIDTSSNEVSISMDQPVDDSIISETDRPVSSTVDKSIPQLQSAAPVEGSDGHNQPVAEEEQQNDISTPEEKEATSHVEIAEGIRIEETVQVPVVADDEATGTDLVAEVVEANAPIPDTSGPLLEETSAKDTSIDNTEQTTDGGVEGEAENPFSDSNAISPWDNTAEQDVFPSEKSNEEPVHGEAEPALVANVQESEVPSRDSEPIVPIDEKKEESLPWDNTAEEDLMPWDSGHNEIKPQNGEDAEDLQSSPPIAEQSLIASGEELDLDSEAVASTSVGNVVDEKSFPSVSSTNLDIEQSPSENKLPWDEEEKTEDAGFPWNATSVSESDNALIINESSNEVAKEDEDFLNQLSAKSTEIIKDQADDKFAFLEEEVGDDTEEQKAPEAAANSNESNIEAKFDFLEEDDNILLDDIMDDDLLEDNEETVDPNATDSIIADNTTDTVVVSSQRKQSKYQPQQLTPQPPQNSFLSQTRSNVFIPTQSPMAMQNFSPNILRTPPPNFAEPNQKLVTSLQQEKKKSDAYDFPQDLYMKNKPKPVKEVKQNIYTQIENSIEHPNPNSMPNFQQDQNVGSFGYQPPPSFGALGNKYSRSNSINSIKSSSFFAELPVPRVNEKKDSVHMKNPYGAIENQSSFTQMKAARRTSIGSVNSTSSPLMPPKKVSSYIPGVAQSPQLENSFLSQRQAPIPSNLNNKFAPSKSPPAIKKPSNPYAPAAVGGHVRHISTTVTNPVDSKPNIVPVPMKSPISISSPLSPSMSVFSANAKNGVNQSNVPNSFVQQSYSGGKYAPSAIPQPPYQPPPQLSQPPLYQQYNQPSQQQQQLSFNQQVHHPPAAQMYNPPAQGSYMPQVQGQLHTLSPQMQQQQPLYKDPQHSNGLGVESHPRMNSFGKSKASTKGHKHSGSSINEVYGSTIERSNATSTGTRKSTALPPSLSKGKHSIPPVSTLTPAPVVINPENLVRRQWPLFSFSAEDKVASMIPTFDGYSHNICNIKIGEIGSILKHDDLVATFPGPLVKGKTKRKDVSKWLEEKLEHSQKANVAPILAEDLIWRCLKLMVEKIQKPGDFLDEGYIKEVAALLNPSLNVTDAMNNTFDIIELARLSKNPLPNKAFNSFSLDENNLAIVHKMLEVGDKKSALEFAVAEGDWAMALLISHLMGPIAFDQTIKLYATTHFQNDAMGQDLSFFVQSKSHGGFSVEQLKGKESWLVENFKIVVPFVMMDNPDYGKILMSIGEALVKAGYTSHGKLSYILSGLPLVPKTLSQIPSSIYGMIVEEVYAFILISSASVPLNFSNGFPHMIPIKIRHGGYLADIGCSVEAKKYCDSAQTSIASKQFFCEPITLLAQSNLCDRLSQVGSGWLSSKLSRPQLDKVWTTLDKSFNKFVSGEDVPQSETKTEGVFAKFTSPASISRTSSTLDLVEVKNHINRKSINGNPYMNSPSNIPQSLGSGGSFGGSGMISGARSYLPPQSIQDNMMARNVSLDSISSYSGSSAPHPAGPNRYTPGTSLANISSESVLTTSSQPVSNSTLLGTPYDENRKPNIFNPTPISKAQYSPKAPPARTMSTTNVYNPAVKSLSSSPVATKSHALPLFPAENPLSRTTTSSPSLPPSLPPKSLKLTPAVQQNVHAVPPIHQRSRKTTTHPQQELPAQSMYESAPITDERDTTNIQAEIIKSAPLPQTQNSPYKDSTVGHGSVYSVNENAEPSLNSEVLTKPLEIDEKQGVEEENVPLGHDVLAPLVENEKPASENESVSQLNNINDDTIKETDILTEEYQDLSVDTTLPTDVNVDNSGKLGSEPLDEETRSEEQKASLNVPDSTTEIQVPAHTKLQDSEKFSETKVLDGTSGRDNEESETPTNTKPTAKPPPIAPFRPNAGRAASRTINRYGPSRVASSKKAINPYASMYAPKEASPKSPYAPSTDAGDSAVDTGIPADVSQVDMFSFGGYIPAPPAPSAIAETTFDDDKKNEVPLTNEDDFGSRNEREDEYASEPSESRSEENHFVPTFKPPTQVGVKSRRSPVQPEVKLTNMFSPPSGFATSLNRPPVSSPIHQFTEEKRYYAQDTGEYYDDVIDDESDDDGSEVAKKAEEERKKAEEEKKRKEQEEKRRKEEAERNKSSNKGTDGGRWFGWLGKGKNDDKPKPIKAKLGEENSFYYDEKLKRWINKKAPLEEQLEASKPPPPPAMKKANTTSAIPSTGGPPTGPPTPSPAFKPPTLGSGTPASSVAKKDGIDDLLTMSTATSARKGGRRGPRRGYVDVMAQK